MTVLVLDPVFWLARTRFLSRSDPSSARPVIEHKNLISSRIQLTMLTDAHILWDNALDGSDFCEKRIPYVVFLDTFCVVSLASLELSLFTLSAPPLLSTWVTCHFLVTGRVLY